MKSAPIFDGHNDTLLRICLPERGKGRTFFERSDLGHIDLPRAREDGCGGDLFACWTPPDPESGWTEESALTPTENGYEVADAPQLDPVYARGTADELVKILFCIEAESEGWVKVVRTAEELERSLREGVLGVVLHSEGAENLGPGPGGSRSSTR
jgi:membrane dipeptidase